jgi:hypothetical protein
MWGSFFSSRRTSIRHQSRMRRTEQVRLTMSSILFFSWGDTGAGHLKISKGASGVSQIHLASYP